MLCKVCISVFYVLFAQQVEPFFASNKVLFGNNADVEIEFDNGFIQFLKSVMVNTGKSTIFYLSLIHI